MITADQLVPQPHELVLRSGTPDTIAGWKALALDGDVHYAANPCVLRAGR